MMSREGRAVFMLVASDSQTALNQASTCCIDDATSRPRLLIRDRAQQERRGHREQGKPHDSRTEQAISTGSKYRRWNVRYGSRRSEKVS